MVTAIKPTDKIQKAKQVLITSLYKGELRNSGKVFLGKCPFHEDSRPSFAIYSETNSFYCFSCGFGGDVITFYQKLNHVGFEVALKELGR